jgi:hypothetical protein
MFLIICMSSFRNACSSSLPMLKSGYLGVFDLELQKIFLYVLDINALIVIF